MYQNEDGELRNALAEKGDDEFRSNHMKSPLNRRAPKTVRRKKAVIIWGLWMLIGFLGTDSNAWYMPEQGRWLSRDPIEERGGYNLYAFVLNRPNTYIDVIGENAFAVAIGVGAEAGALAPVVAIPFIGYMGTPGPGTGNCSRGEHAILQNAVDIAKDHASRLGGCRGGGMGCWQLRMRRNAWLELAIARSIINVRCYGGGDPGHQIAAANAWLAMGSCQIQMKCKKCGTL